MKSFDYIIVGAGSAGCVLADKLSKDGKNSVLILEAGGKDWHPLIHIPAGFYKIHNDPKLNWNYSSEPEKGLNGRSIGNCFYRCHQRDGGGGGRGALGCYGHC